MRRILKLQNCKGARRAGTGIKVSEYKKRRSANLETQKLSKVRSGVPQLGLSPSHGQVVLVNPPVGGVALCEELAVLPAPAKVQGGEAIDRLVLGGRQGLHAPKVVRIRHPVVHSAQDTGQQAGLK